MKIKRKTRINIVRLSRLLRTIGITGAIAAGIIYASSFSDKHALTEKDFDNAVWKKTYNSYPSFIKYFEYENISPTAENLELYNQMVKKRNNGRIKGRIEVPDLDGDGSVGAGNFYK